MGGTSETRNKLKHWERGQAESEGLAAVVLANNGYEGINPVHPLGGPDGGKDIVCFRNGKKWIGAVFFPITEAKYTDIKKKFLHDLDGAKNNKAHGIAFVCNQYLTDSDRNRLAMLAKEKEMDADIYHLERMVAMLNTPQMFGTRLKFLEIPMSKEEEIEYLETVGSKQFNAIQQKLDDLYRYVRSERANDEFWEFSSRSEEEIDNAINELFDKI